MVRIQLTSLDEFIASLSKLDYDTAKTASSKVMEASITKLKRKAVTSLLMVGNIWGMN